MRSLVITCYVFVLACGLALVTSSAALAQGVPIQHVRAQAFVYHQDTEEGPFTVYDSFNAEAQAQAPVEDLAIAHGRTSLLGDVGAYSAVSVAADSSENPLRETAEAVASADQVTHWIATTSDPAIQTAVIDVSISIDGFLVTYDGSASAIGPWDLFAFVFFHATAYSSVASLTVFSATATLDGVTGLSTTGPWGGAFNEAGVVDYSGFFPAAFAVSTNETFAWGLGLTTQSYAVRPIELEATADFLNTGSFELSTSTPGVTLTRVSELAIEVEIDIKPGSDPNCFNNNGHGVIPVAVLTTDTFDASTVDPFTLTLDGASTRLKGRSSNAGSLQDVDADGDFDLVVQIEDVDGTYQEGDTIATLTGETYDGFQIEGQDSICIVP